MPDGHFGSCVGICTEFLVVPRWMVFCELVRHVGEAFLPDKVKLVFLDAIFYPVKIHAEGF